MLSGSSFQRRRANARNALPANVFNSVFGIYNMFLVFDLRILVLACFTNNFEI